MAAGTAKKGKTGLSQEQIITKFNQMRQEQRILVNKISELEAEISEHSVVIETLKNVDVDRKCFRMVGGILSERTVKEVLPALQNNKMQIEQVIEKLKFQLTEKGKELVKFREEHNITIRGEKENEKSKSNTSNSTSGVLVSGTASKES
ncbi:prefoldin subunit 2-like [Hydractinia symbiolongicarpus]|uniref:prefoldin subunit 2-like n=1 Tax=Hydractinia symbiolongicarpus TaxID=13093 RepID=UPI00254BEF1A|nr:prefoldin subunit 2-like [Hydractinia symbiolongicarpus]